MQTAVMERRSFQLESLHPEAQQLLALGQRQRWDEVRILGFAPPLDAPVYLDKWVLTPGHLDSTPLPPRPQYRLNSLFAAGIRPDQIVLAHERPKLLTGSTQPKKTWSDVWEQIVKTGEVAKDLTIKAAPVAAKIGTGLAVAVGAAAVVASAGTLLFVALAISTIAVDPILIVVIDDCWIEIDRWDVV